jgi:hypothetical protein
MTKPNTDSRYPSLCFCPDWTGWGCNLTGPNDFSPEEYAERIHMAQDVRNGQIAPANMDRWHGQSCCPGKNPHG